MRLGLAYDTWQSKNIRQVYARTAQKANYISVYGVKLWNALQADMPSLPFFPVDYRVFTSSTGLPVFAILGKQFFLNFIGKIGTVERNISTFR